MKKFLRFLFFVLLIALAGWGIWFFMVYFEGEEPEILLSRDIKMIGQETAFDITCSDRKSGIRSASVTISQGEKQYTVGSLTLPGRGAHIKTIPISVLPEDLNLHDGAATIDISVTDYSLRKNKQVVAFDVVIDTIPPQISPASFQHYINPGGSCVVAYRLSEDVSRSGVQIDNDYFPSYPKATGGGTLHISYFAAPIIDTASQKIHILAEDNAGNTTFSPISFHARDKKFRSDR
ncbi:MAG: hypothetical protein Q7J01_09480, partial [Syntrophales bacterium]|nr:hypothetical protein [Syntrophales bacterium]